MPALEYTIESEEGNIKVINLAKANDSTGTLYFATWQSPEKEEAHSSLSRGGSLLDEVRSLILKIEISHGPR